MGSVDTLKNGGILKYEAFAVHRAVLDQRNDHLNNTRVQFQKGMMQKYLFKSCVYQSDVVPLHLKHD